MRSAISGSSASARRTWVSTSVGALATKGSGIGSASTSVPAVSSAVRAVYSDNPAAFSVCSRSA